MPLPRRATPAEREDGVKATPQTRTRVADSREIRHRPHVNKNRTGDQVGRNRHHIEHQGRAKVWPQAHLIGNREAPVDKPHAAEMHHYKQCCCHQGEQRHGLCTAINRLTPGTVGDMQYRGQESTGVAQPDPENEVGQIAAPDCVVVHAGGTDADDQLIKPRHEEENPSHGHRRGQQHPVFRTRLQHGGEDVLVNFRVTWLSVIKHRLSFFSAQECTFVK